MSSGHPTYIVVEGPIGVGKTSLAKRLAKAFSAHPLLVLATYRDGEIAAPLAQMLGELARVGVPRIVLNGLTVDGASRLQTLFLVVLPMSTPGLVAGGLFAYIATWNNFLFAFLFTTTEATKTLPVIMRLFALGEPAVWGVSASGAMITTLPVALLFLLFQRMMISGLSAGAVKN